MLVHKIDLNKQKSIAKYIYDYNIIINQCQHVSRSYINYENIKNTSK